MGRSVSFPTGAQVAYCLLDADDADADADADDTDWGYECLCEDIRAAACAAFPSFDRHEGWRGGWRGREARVLLRNSYADIGLSVYGGIAAIWIVQRDDPAYRDKDARVPCSSRAQHWLGQIAPRFARAFAQLERIGCMSNGESVYRHSQAE